MAIRHHGRLVILSGPSCAGKSPLKKALNKFYPHQSTNLLPVVLYNSRPPRPMEKDGIDYHFRPRGEVAALGQTSRYLVLDVRGDLQALDLDRLAELLQKGDAFFEGNPFVGSQLLSHPGLGKFNKLSVFMAPLSREEIIYLRSQPGFSLPELVTDLMRRKLLRRTRKQKGELSLQDLEEIERRATSAYRELGLAHLFQYVIANHDGEDSENWDAFYYPLGDARQALLAFSYLLDGERLINVETWEADLLD
jgi:guanylate kinase